MDRGLCAVAESTPIASPLPEPERDLALSQYWTPPALAKRMVDMLGLPRGSSVLEPAAGCGRLVEPLLAADLKVVACELDRRWAKVLRDRWPDIGITRCDYPARKFPPFDLHYDGAVLNPPYEHGLDGRFLARALEDADVVVALCRVQILFGTQRYASIWEPHGYRLDRVAFLPRRPSFGGGSPRHDFCVLRFRSHDDAADDFCQRGDDPRPTVEHWLLTPEGEEECA